MADVVTNYAAISTDALSYVIADEMIALSERRLLLNQFSKKHTLASRMGKTLRVDRYNRLNNPTAVLQEGVPPDAVALNITYVDTTVEQWGLVALLTDVAEVTVKHPALQIATDRVGRAIEETQEREMANVLMAGTNVFYATGVADRVSLVAKYPTTNDILKATTLLRDNGAMDWDGGLLVGVMPPQIESYIVGNDTSFSNAAAYSQVVRLNAAEIGTWGGVRWSRGNFLPKFLGVGAPGTQSASVAGYSNETGAGGGIGGATVVVIARDAQNGYERKISLSKAVAAGKDTADITTPTSTNYVYDIYQSSTTPATAYKRVFTGVAANTLKTLTATTYTNGTTATPTANPASASEVFVMWVFGRDAYGRVELNELSMMATITPDQATYSNPLRQGRKVGAKFMAKWMILDNNYFARVEANSTFGANLPA